MSLAPPYRRCQHGAKCFTTCPGCEGVKREADPMVLERIRASLVQKTSAPADPFGDAVRTAQARAEAAADAVIPHPVQPVPAEDRDTLWRSIEDYGRGG